MTIGCGRVQSSLRQEGSLRVSVMNICRREKCLVFSKLYCMVVIMGKDSRLQLLKMCKFWVFNGNEEEFV